MRIGFAPRLAGLYAAIFTMVGVQLPFFPLWLKAKDLAAGEIGLVLAVPMIVRVLAIPVATRLADRRDVLREGILVASCFSVAGYLLLAFAEGLPAILFAFAIASLAFTPVMPLAETYALRGLTARGRAYGPVRLWGSAAFIAGTFIAGFSAQMLSPRSLIWLIFIATVAVAASAFTLEPLPHFDSARKAQAPTKPLLRDGRFIALLMAASLIQASHAVYYGFSALAWRTDGFNSTVIALLWALGVIAEIVLFAMSSRLPQSFDPPLLLLLGALGGGLRWTAMAFDLSGFALPFLQLLHALSFGATHLGTLTYLARYIPVGQGATAQGYLAIALGASMAAATSLSGLFYESYGPLSYAAMALAAVAGGICALILWRK